MGGSFCCLFCAVPVLPSFSPNATIFFGFFVPPPPNLEKNLSQGDDDLAFFDFVLRIGGEEDATDLFVDEDIVSSFI